MTAGLPYRITDQHWDDGVVRLEQVLAKLEGLSSTGTVCRLGSGASEGEIEAAEERLQVCFPDPVIRFWSSLNGLEVADPPLRIFSLSELWLDEGLLFFTICNGTVRLAFDIRSMNVANQWSILAADSGCRITYTMASFWSSHMWTWLLKRRAIW